MSAEVRVTGRPAAIEVASRAAIRLDVNTVSGGAGGGGYTPPTWARNTRYCNLLLAVDPDYDVLGTPSLIRQGFYAYFQPAAVDPNTYPEWTSGSVSGIYAGHSDGTTPATLTFLGTPSGGDFFYNHVQIDASVDVNNPTITDDDILFYVPSTGGGPNRVVQIELGNTATTTAVDAASFTGNLAGLDPANVQQALAIFDAYSGGGGGSGTVTGVTGVAPISVTASSTTPEVSITAATTSVAGSMSSSDKSKLDGIATGATANSSDAYLLDRTHHTGTQAATTITGLAAVATTGAYGDLTGRPSLAAVATTGSASDLTSGTVASARLSLTATDIPTLASTKITGLAAVATTGAYGDLTGRPSLAAIATSGSASDLSTGTVASARLSTKAVGGLGAGSGVALTATAASILSSTITLPACAAGDMLLVEGSFTINNNSTASRTYTGVLKIGSTSILTFTLGSQAVATRVHAFQAFIRVISTTSQSASANLVHNTVAGTSGVAVSCSGVATETISSSLALDLTLVSSTGTVTQTGTLEHISVAKVAA
jgi:hypothetical protein